MKRISLSLLLVVSWLFAMAQHWNAPSVYDYPSSTPVYARLRINGSLPKTSTKVEMAAFIDDVCRATTSSLTTSLSSDDSFYYLRVLGNSEDEGKEIKFKVFYDGLEYAVTPNTRIKYNSSNTYMAVGFYLDAITGVELTEPLVFSGNIPCTKDLTQDIKLTYSSANGSAYTPVGKSTLLSELTYSWVSASTSAFSITDNVISVTGECMNVPLLLTVSGPEYKNTQFSVDAATMVTASKPVSFTFPSSVNLNRFETTEISLSDIQGNGFDPALVTFRFEKIHGVPMAVTSYYQKNGIYYFRLYANMMGEGEYEVYYGENAMKTTDGKDKGTVAVMDKIQISEGWNWMSVYGVDNSGSINLIEGKNFKNWVASKVGEIRSQTGILSNDLLYGMFGDITSLDPENGMYKVNALSALSIDMGMNTTVPLGVRKTIRKGYNWMNNPYQIDIPLFQLSSAILVTPNKGDMIIGKEGFVEYDGTQWDGQADFVLQAGKGYIYYSTRETTYSVSYNKSLTAIVSESLNTGIRTAAPAVASVRKRVAGGDTKMWNYDASLYSDNMAMVAVVDGVDNMAEYSVGAFVNGECRGEGGISLGGKMFVNVAGKAGETVSFKLLNKNTGETYDAPEKVLYTQKVGSLAMPVSLTVNDNVTSISDEMLVDADIIDIRDMSGRKVASMSKGVYMVTYKVNNDTYTRKIRK